MKLDPNFFSQPLYYITGSLSSQKTQENEGLYSRTLFFSYHDHGRRYYAHIVSRATRVCGRRVCCGAERTESAWRHLLGRAGYVVKGIYGSKGAAESVIEAEVL